MSKQFTVSVPTLKDLTKVVKKAKTKVTNKVKHNAVTSQVNSLVERITAPSETEVENASLKKQLRAAKGLATRYKNQLTS